MNREDFPLLKTGIIYFDNGATSLKPKAVLNSMNDYYENYGANIHRGDYDASYKASEIYEQTREICRDFIGAASKDEIVFTSGTTDSLNKIIFGFFRQYLKKGDEVLITKAEHASLLLPFMMLEKEIGIHLVYMPLSEEYRLTFESFKNSVTQKTKVVAIAGVSNVVGDHRPLKEIGAYCRENQILFLVDGAQSVPHQVTNVLEDHIDFLAFSAHKMLGPTGIGVLYGRKELLKKMIPLEYGGDMNQSFTSLGEVTLKDVPLRLEAGTPPIAEVIGLRSAILYLKEIGMEEIAKQEMYLKKYFLEQVKDLPQIEVYNASVEGGNVIFNIQDVFSQDAAIYLNHFKICTRAGAHCAKALKEELPVQNTVRLSFYFYNTKKEIDTLVAALKKSDTLYDIIL